MSDLPDNLKNPTSGHSDSVESLSRSEIESALQGGKIKKKPSKRKVEETPFLDIPPRRQQVLGGDLSGISSRPKSIGHKLIDVSVVNWIVGLTVLAIVGAFFWPQGHNSVTEIANQQIAEIEGDTQLEEVGVNDQGGSNFSRDTDLNRANDYRLQDAQELQIRNLLVQAREFVRKRQFITPQDVNAVSSYQAILAIDPQNVDAQQGLSDIKQHFHSRAINALAENNEESAKELLANLEKVENNSQESQLVKSAISEYQLSKQLNTLLANAKSANEKNQLILPARENALFYYQQALAIDPGNASAQNGIKTIADAYIQKANDAVLIGDFNRATAHLATVSVIDSQHNSITLIEAMIARAKPIAEAAQKSIENQDSSPAVEQQDTTPDVATQAQTNQTAANNVEPAEVVQQQTTRTPSAQSREQAAIDQRYLENGLEAYYRGEYDRAATLLQPLADKGIARAQFRLGYMHYLGRGFNRNRQRADRIIRAALPAIQKFAEESRAWAQSDLGSLYEDGLVLRRDYGEAVYWYRSAAEQGYPGAQTNLGIMYARGRGVTASRRTAIEWFQRAAKQGDIAARRNLSSLGIN